ncbi:uncharacterized protein M6B38_272535 [Iris pallida]|uniref:Uncharacterized protein n=1 Tax=Iris pallida TaxID=29817 RepID=A0AAX6I741_IRIPA|nr:uncharacterized protein M6B38_272535 [Iris pallida]
MVVDVTGHRARRWWPGRVWRRAVVAGTGAQRLDGSGAWPGGARAEEWVPVGGGEGLRLRSVEDFYGDADGEGRSRIRTSSAERGAPGRLVLHGDGSSRMLASVRPRSEMARGCGTWVRQG